MMAPDLDFLRFAAVAFGLVAGWSALFVTGTGVAAWIVRLAWPPALLAMAMLTGVAPAALAAGLIAGALLHASVGARLAALAARRPPPPRSARKARR